MTTPRLSGYPVDREIVRRAQLARQARRARHAAIGPSGPRGVGCDCCLAEGIEHRQVPGGPHTASGA